MGKITENSSCGGFSSLSGEGGDGVSLYSSSFVDFLSVKASAVDYVSDYINEIFMHFYLKVLEAASLLSLSGTDEFAFRGRGRDWSIYVAAARAEQLKVSVMGRICFYVTSVILYVASFFLLLVTVVILPGLVLLARRSSGEKISQEFSVIRSPASYNKMRFLNDSGKVKFYYDDILQGSFSGRSIYSFGGAGERILSVFVVPFLAFRDFFGVARDSGKLLGWWFSGFVVYYFSKRILHKCIFEYYLDLLLRQHGVVSYYTGNKEDRFAILEKRLCKKYGVHSVCIPHGIEYAFKTPAGLVGDIFYCTTEHARQHLSNLYSSDQAFIYDPHVAHQMFSRHHEIASIDGIVFFPESRELDINRIILGRLLEFGYDILVKLHPKDSQENYKKYAGQVTFVSDYDFSISNKICLARKSTVLVEAIYNNSIPIAVLTDLRDRGYVEHMLPSLIDEHIMRVYSFEQLACVLAKYQVAV